MAEHVLRGQVAVYPRAEGGKQFVVNDLGELYRVPLDEQAVASLLKDLAMDNDELAQELEKARAQAKAQPGLVLPNGASAS